MRVVLGLAMVLAAAGCARSQPASAPAVAATPNASSSPEASPLPQAEAVAGADQLKLHNELVDCTMVTAARLFALGDVVLGRFTLRSLKSRGECGCMSSVVAYSVVETLEVPEEAKAAGATGEYERVYGSIEPRDQDDSLWLVVSTDRRHFQPDALTLRLRCKGPD
ncbi:MAG TPA: DUF2195 family protein [Polyangiales bacterium]